MNGLIMRGALVLLREEKHAFLTPTTHQLSEALRLGVVIETAKPEPTGFHTVLACGPDVESVKPGDVVVCESPGGTAVKFDGETLLVYRDDQMMAVRT